MIVRAQPQHGPAISVAYEFGVPNSIDRTRNLINIFAASGGGRAYDHTVRGGIEMAADPFDIGRVAALRLSAGGSTGQYHSIPFLTPTGVRREYVVDVSTLFLDADLRLLLPLISGWSLDPGAWITYRAGGRYVESLNNLDPGATPFDNGAQSVVVAQGDTLGASRFRFGLVLASRFTFPISSSLLISPEISSRIDLPAIGLGIRALSIGAGLTFRLRGRSAAEAAVRSADGDQPARSSRTRNDSMAAARNDSVATSSAPDPPPDSVAPLLSAAVDLRAVDADGTIRQRGSITAELEIRHLTVVLPSTVRLDPAGLDTSSITSAERVLFVDSSRSAAYRACREVVLDELGARLRGDSSYSVQLRGAASRLGSARAALARRWRVEEDRILPVVRERNGSILDLAPVPGHAGPFASIDREWLARSFRVSRLDIVPEITAAAGVRSWRVSVRQGDRIIGGSSMDGVATDMLALDLPDDGSGSAVAPLVAELVAEDSAGAVVTARDTLPLQLADPIDVDLSPERLVWKVVLPSGSCRPCADSVEAMLMRVAARIQARDRIVVGEIADAGSRADDGKMLAVARRLSTLLRARHVTPQSLGADGKTDVARGPRRSPAGDAVGVVITIVRSVE